MNVTFKNIRNVVRRLRKRADKTPRAIEDQMLKAVFYTQSKIPPYPPKPPTSWYRRTHNLERSVHGMIGKVPNALGRVEKKSSRIMGFVGTNISYAKWVIDHDRQAQVHTKNGWWTLQSVIPIAKPGVFRILRGAAPKIVEVRD